MRRGLWLGMAVAAVAASGVACDGDEDDGMLHDGRPFMGNGDDSSDDGTDESDGTDGDGTDGTPIDAGPGIDASMNPDAAMVPPDAAGGVGEPPELAGITLYHNQVRQAVDTPTPLPALEWDPALAATAAAWVAQCQNNDGNNILDHNPNRSQGHPFYVGENIYASSGTATAMGAVNLWAAEKANYNYDANSCIGTCGHYTQIVWRTTLKVGCAVGNCPNIQYGHTIVCDYGPGGNINGQRPY